MSEDENDFDLDDWTVIVSLEYLARNHDVIFDTSMLDATSAPQPVMLHYQRTLLETLEYRKSMHSAGNVLVEARSLLDYVEPARLGRMLRHISRRVDNNVPLEYYRLIEHLYTYAKKAGVVLPNSFNHWTDLEVAALGIIGNDLKSPVLVSGDKKLCQTLVEFNKDFLEGNAPDYVLSMGRAVQPWYFEQEMAAFVPFIGKTDCKQRRRFLKSKGTFDLEERKHGVTYLKMDDFLDDGKNDG
jgi:hypothetical protein